MLVKGPGQVMLKKLWEEEREIVCVYVCVCFSSLALSWFSLLNVFEVFVHLCGGFMP